MNSIYLCPRLSRDQIIAAIEGPARVFGGDIEPALVARIANDMGTEPDQLPLMQHALMRLWEEALMRNRAAPVLRLDDYLAAGGLKASLSRHADEILAEVTRVAPERDRIARHLFCLVTEGEGERATRRLAPVAEVAAVSEQPIEEVASVADAFRAPGRSLLMPAPDQALTAATVLDISHESLIRQWDTLKEWDRREAESVRLYREAERNVQRWLAGRAAVWQPEELRALLAWRKQERPNAAWAARYGGDFQLLDVLLERSRIQWNLARYAIIPAILLFAVLSIPDVTSSIIKDHSKALLGIIITIGIFAAGFGIVYYGILKNFRIARIWTVILLFLFILILASQFSNLLSGEKSWEEYQISDPVLTLLIIACLGFVFLQVHRLARHRRRSAWLIFLLGRLPSKRSDATDPPTLAPSDVLPLAGDQRAAGSSDLELRRGVKEEARDWRATVRRDAAIMGSVVALPVMIGLVLTGVIWWGVRQVETEMKFAAIPAGHFMMGSPDSEADRQPDEGPVHEVSVKAFDLGSYEVTLGEWRRVMIFSIFSDASAFERNDRRPVVNVSWSDAKRFLRVMSLFGRQQFRLPSEAEWEFAARAGTTTPRYWGDKADDACVHENIADQRLKKKDPDKVVADCDDGYAQTAPVGSFPPNPWGLYDMLGNVGEWVEDCYVNNYRDTPTDGSPNRREPCKARVARGGAWLSRPPNVRASFRFDLFDREYTDVGFRVARSSTSASADAAPASSTQ